MLIFIMYAKSFEICEIGGFKKTGISRKMQNIIFWCHSGISNPKSRVFHVYLYSRHRKNTKKKWKFIQFGPLLT